MRRLAFCYTSFRSYPFLWLPFLVYLWVYPWSIGLVAADKVPPGTEWLASVLLILESLVAAFWLAVNFGAVRAALAALAVLAGAWGVEALGVTTGFPFGRYIYTEQLIFKIGPVPLGILSAWLMLVVTAYFTACYCWPRLAYWASLLAGAGLALLSDLGMEPVATAIQDYWRWQDSGPYYGVPSANFLAWFVAALILLLALSLILRPALKQTLVSRPTGFRLPFFPLALFLMNLLMFTVINLARGNWLAGVIGLATGAGLAAVISRVEIKKSILAI